jgi:hypothetical protein
LAGVFHIARAILRPAPPAITRYRIERNQESKIMSQFDSRLENFLFAEIGTGESGVTLTMISAFARCGSDPWVEAARLSALPRAGAAEALNLFLGKMPSAWCNLSDRPATTARLLKLLPITEARIPAVLSHRPDLRAFSERHLLGIASVLLLAVIILYLIK